MKKVFWSNSTAQRTSGYNKQSTQNMFLEKAFECSPNTLQWIPMNQNKQDSENRSVAYYSEVPNYDREQVYNWYQTVPLRHDSFVDDVNPKGTIEEHMNRKGRILNERQKRYRTSFTTFQLGRLEEEFQKDKYAVGMKRMRLASELNLTEKQVKVWFQNRRMKYKRVCQRIHNRRVAMTKYWE